MEKSLVSVPEFEPRAVQPPGLDNVLVMRGESLHSAVVFEVLVVHSWQFAC